MGKNIKGRINKTAVIFILLLLINSTLMLQDKRGKDTVRISEAGFTIMSVFQQGFSWISDLVIETGNSINELKYLKTEYNRLLKEMLEYETLEKDYIDLKRENTELKKLLQFEKQDNINKIPAQITGNDPGSFYNTITINKGSSHGVRVNMPVVAYYDGFQGLVGRIAETGYASSKVIPLYDRNFYAAARLQNIRYEGIVNGTGSSRSFILMSHVNKNARDRIAYGDLIVTSGMSTIYPPGIYIGRVVSIGAREYETSLELEIEPVVDFSRLEYVFVLQKESINETE